MSRRLTLALSVALLTGFLQAQTPREITFEEIARPRPGEWPSYNGQLSANRHSPLDHINTRNVASLVPVWTHEMGGERALQITPLVVDGVMYVAAVNEVRALDARSGRQIWQFARPQTPGLVPTGDPASGINRSIAVLGNRVFLQTDHAHLLAVDRQTGALLWDVEMADARQNYGATGALLIVNDLVIAGISAGDEGVRGFLDAYRASTGERVWRFWTVPARGEPGSETWVGKALEHGCATTWLTGSYDPAANLLYWPTGNPCPDYNGDERKGDNLYSIVDHRARSSDRTTPLAFSIHAARPARLGCEPAADADRRRFSRRTAEAARRRESKWILLRARSTYRRNVDGGAVREESYMGLRHRRGRPATTFARI